VDFYTRKKAFLRSLRQAILIEEVGKQSTFLSVWEIKYGAEYGFGRKQIDKALKPYVNMGFVEIIGDVIHIKRGEKTTTQASTPVTSNRPVNRTFAH